MKKILIILVAVTMVLSLFAVSVSTAHATDERLTSAELAAAGRFGSGRNIAGTWVWDEVVTFIPSLSNARIEHNGTEYIFGGRTIDGRVLRYAQVRRNNMPAVSFQGRRRNMPTARYWHTATVRGNRAFIIGGRNEYGVTGSVYVHDFDNNTWEMLDEQMPNPRFGHHIREVAGWFFVIDGFDDDGKFIEIVDIFMPDGNGGGTWHYSL